MKDVVEGLPHQQGLLQVVRKGRHGTDGTVCNIRQTGTELGSAFPTWAVYERLMQSRARGGAEIRSSLRMRYFGGKCRSSELESMTVKKCWPCFQYAFASDNRRIALSSGCLVFADSAAEPALLAVFAGKSVATKGRRI
jgi:hypothetical protein